LFDDRGTRSRWSSADPYQPAEAALIRRRHHPARSSVTCSG